MDWHIKRILYLYLYWPEETGEVDITGQAVNPGSELDQANVVVIIIWIENKDKWVLHYYFILSFWLGIVKLESYIRIQNSPSMIQDPGSKLNFFFATVT